MVSGRAIHVRPLIKRLVTGFGSNDEKEEEKMKTLRYQNLISENDPRSHMLCNFPVSLSFSCMGSDGAGVAMSLQHKKKKKKN